ncbi:uncharacterized protein LOC107608074 [Arachis ipaensis]|uniref:uncharacterized protein LOC107608074 n=1 Tax=Arachis ipaensis TaxID=130454 RepID=UPI0007AFBE57|nr:uncharacterized protein LOC107608074 [Arachis ipaensis]
MTNLVNMIQANTAITTHAMQQTRQSVRNESGEGAEDCLDGVPRTLAAFLKVDLPIFNGSTNPTEAGNWFQAVERALRTQYVPYDQFVEYAAYHLVGEAQQWWQRERRQLHQQNMDITWTLFQEAFYKKYFHESIKEARELEFLWLKQGYVSCLVPLMIFVMWVEHLLMFVDYDGNRMINDGLMIIDKLVIMSRYV